MSEVSKNQLKYENSVSFPNNNSGAITPADLRAFNVDMIDSTVNQTIYTEDSASFYSNIDVLQTEVQTLSTQSSGSATTGSNTFIGNQTIEGNLTLSDGFGFNVTLTPDTLSNSLTINDNVTIYGDLSADLQAGYLWLGDSNGRAIAVPSSSIAAGGSTDLGPLNAFTASQQTYNTNNNTKWSNLGAQSGSWVTNSQTGSFARTNVTNTFTADQNIQGNLNITGTITANEIHTIIESSSVIFSSGSNILGDSTSDTQTLNGTVKVSGSQQITGSLGVSSTATINGDVTIQNGGGLNVAGQILAQSGLTALNGSGIELKANLQGSGSAYPNITTTVDNVTDPTNVYASFQLIDQSQNALIAIAANSYTSQYPNTTIPILFGGGNNPGGDNAGIAFPSNGQADHWKKSNFKYGVDVTGSLKVSGSSTLIGNQTITGNTTITGSVRSNVDITAPRIVTNQIDSFTGNAQNLTISSYGSGSITIDSVGNGIIANGPTQITGSLGVSGVTTLKNIVNITGSLGVSSQISARGGLFVTGGNLIVSDNNISTNKNLTIGLDAEVFGTITGHNNLNVYNPYASINISDSANNSGSAYTGLVTYVDTTSDPTNVFASIQLVDQTNGTNFGMGYNSYTGLYPAGTVQTFFGGGFYSGSDTVFAVPSADRIDFWKPTTFKYPVIVSGSVRGNVNTQTITSNTASLDFSTSNFFKVTLVSGSTTRIRATNIQPGQTVNLLITQPSSGWGSTTFDSNFKFAAVAPYTASAASNAQDIVTFITFDSTSVYSAAVKNLI